MVTRENLNMGEPEKDTAAWRGVQAISKGTYDDDIFTEWPWAADCDKVLTCNSSKPDKTLNKAWGEEGDAIAFLLSKIPKLRKKMDTLCCDIHHRPAEGKEEEEVKRDYSTAPYVESFAVIDSCDPAAWVPDELNPFAGLFFRAAQKFMVRKEARAAEPDYSDEEYDESDDLSSEKPAAEGAEKPAAVEGAEKPAVVQGAEGAEGADAAGGREVQQGEKPPGDGAFPHTLFLTSPPWGVFPEAHDTALKSHQIMVKLRP